MDCLPSRTSVLEYTARWGIEPTFSDFKSRGFQLEDSKLEHADRCERLILIMALAMHWCVRIGLEDAQQRPTALEKKRKFKPTVRTGVSRNFGAVCFPFSLAGEGI